METLYKSLIDKIYDILPVRQYMELIKLVPQFDEIVNKNQYQIAYDLFVNSKIANKEQEKILK